MATAETAQASATDVIAGGQMRVTNEPNTCLATTVLGSAVVVIVHDSEAKVTGLLHFLLPDFEIKRESATENPALFANSGIPQLYRHCYKLGADKARMVCYLIGAGDVLSGGDTFHLGSDNLNKAVELLKKNGVTPNQEWTGGHEGRRVRFHTIDGRLEVVPVDGTEVNNA